MSQGNSLHKAVSALAAFSVAISSASPVLLGGASVAAISVAMVSPAAAENCVTGVTTATMNNLLVGDLGKEGATGAAITKVEPVFSKSSPVIGLGKDFASVKGQVITEGSTTGSVLTVNDPNKKLQIPVGLLPDGQFSNDGANVKYDDAPPPDKDSVTTGLVYGADNLTTVNGVITGKLSKPQSFAANVDPQYGEPYVTGVTTNSDNFLRSANLQNKNLTYVNGADYSDAQLNDTTSLGCGYKADASAAKATAVGSNTKAGENAVALGYKAQADLHGTAVGSQSEAGVNSTALGFEATALGENSVAIGKGATTGKANNAVAVGQGAQAKAYGAVALGNGAEANGANSTAMGHNASTGGYTNATAIGAGATATRDNQVMLGTASNTYTAPGITSAASKAAQKGPLQVVTTDRNGNLASDGGTMYNNINNINSSITNLNANVAGLWNNVSRLNGAIDRLNSGVAMSMALGGMYLPEHKNYAVTANMGFYNNKQAIGINGMARLNETFVANGGIAFGVNGFGPEGNTDVGGRVGLTAAW